MTPRRPLARSYFPPFITYLSRAGLRAEGTRVTQQPCQRPPRRPRPPASSPGGPTRRPGGQEAVLRASGTRPACLSLALSRVMVGKPRPTAAAPLTGLPEPNRAESTTQASPGASEGPARALLPAFQRDGVGAGPRRRGGHWEQRRARAKAHGQRRGRGRGHPTGSPRCPLGAGTVPGIHSHAPSLSASGRG